MVTNSRIQEPETKSAMLMSAGSRRFTQHTYSHAEVTAIPACGAEHKPETGIAYLYKCEETGILRRWGFETIK